MFYLISSPGREDDDASSSSSTSNHCERQNFSCGGEQGGEQGEETLEDYYGDDHIIEKPKSMTIFASTPDGQKLYYKVRKVTPVYIVQDAISKWLGVEKSQLRFLFNGRNLATYYQTLTLDEVGMEDGDCLFVFFPQTGC